MNYGKNEVEKTLRKTNSRSQKITSHLVLLLTKIILCLLYTSPSPRDVEESRMPSSA